MSAFFELAAPGLGVMIVLIVSSAFFSGSETALFYLSRDELRRFRLGKPRERIVAGLLQDPDRLLTAVLFWNLVINLTYFAVSVITVGRLAEDEQTAAAGVFGFSSLLLIILLGEVLPKSLAVVWRQQLAAAVGWPLAATVRFLDPISRPLRKLSRVLHRTLWPHVKREPYLRADDLERAVEASHFSQDVIRHEREVLHSILDLSEISAEEVMRPRGTYVSLKAPVSSADLNGKVPAGDYLVIQAQGSEDVERAIPIASFSALPEHNLEQSAEAIVHVPWCASLARTLQMLRDQVCSLASVVNEYGETIGIVTYEDIIDTILVPSPSRARRLLQREPVLQIGPGRYHVEGITTLRYLSKKLEIDFDPTSDEQVTVAGLLHEELEHIPEVGDECHWQGFRIQVIEVSKPGQLRAMLAKDEG